MTRRRASPLPHRLPYPTPRVHKITPHAQIGWPNNAPTAPTATEGAQLCTLGMQMHRKLGALENGIPHRHPGAEVHQRPQAWDVG